MDPRHPRDSGHVMALVLGGVALVSASGLVFEIALTRVFAVTQFYHFAFLTVSMALLGLGASGSALAVFPALGRGGPHRWYWFALLQGATTVVAYAIANALPFDSYAIAWDRAQLLYLALYYVTLSAPFFFGGLVVAVLLTGIDQPRPVSSHLIYGVSLGGSGIGCVVAVAAIDMLGAGGTIVLAALVAVLGAAAFAVVDASRPSRLVTWGALVVALVVLGLVVPPPLAMRLSPYKDLSAALRFPGATKAATAWQSGTRIDLVESEGIRSLPGLSFSYPGEPPLQDGVTFDGDDLNPVPRTAPEDAEHTSFLLTALPWRLRPGGGTLVIEPRGGADVQLALGLGAESVIALERLGTVVDLIGSTGYNIYADPRVEVVAAEPRTYLARESSAFDVVDLALTSPYRPVASGAYSLAEDYTLTVDAVRAYLDHLDSGGILMVSRWVQTPPSESMRLLATLAAAVRDMGLEPDASVVMLRNYSNAVALVCVDGWSESDLAAIRAFAESLRFDIVAMPGVTAAETNRFSVVPEERYSVLAAELLSSSDPDAVYASSSFDIAPATDDHPFFGHYFKWNQTGEILDNLGRNWLPFGGAGYLVLIAFLILAALSALFLIVTPLAVRLRPVGARSVTPWTVGYFSLLGMAFLLVEIPLVQQYILLVGSATSAFAAVLFAILVASGVGSILSPRVPWRLSGWVVTGAGLLAPLVIEWITPLVLPAPLPVRIVVGALVIAPLGLMMGTMFPHGVTYLERMAPQLVPWAWGINGTVSVVASVTAALLALTFGFRFVLTVGAVCYGFATLLVPAMRSLGGPSEGNEQHPAEVLAAD